MLKAILLAPLIPMLLVGLLFMAIGFTSSGTLNIGVPIMAMGIGSIIAYPFMIIWGIPVIIVLEKKLRNKKNTKLVLYTIAGIIPGLALYLIFNFGHLPGLVTLISSIVGPLIGLTTGIIMRKSANSHDSQT